jgi:hypothetical protein
VKETVVHLRYLETGFRLAESPDEHFIAGISKGSGLGWMKMTVYPLILMFPRLAGLFLDRRTSQESSIDVGFYMPASSKRDGMVIGLSCSQ